MDKVIYGGIGAVLTAGVMLIAGLVGIGGGNEAPPPHEHTDIPPASIVAKYDCPSGWTLELGYAHDYLSPSCTKGDYRVWKNADNGFSHGAKVNKDNVIQGDFIYDPAEIPGWLD